MNTTNKLIDMNINCCVNCVNFKTVNDTDKAKCVEISTVFYGKEVSINNIALRIWQDYKKGKPYTVQRLDCKFYE